ncbi:MAG: cytochrome c oxidase assembly factor Coa1 family protein [Acidobacteriota bacterium]
MSEGNNNRSCIFAAGGCCGCLALLLGLFVILPLGGGVALFQGLKQTDVYTGAVDVARADARVVEELGEPIETGILFSGSINTSPNSGDADFSIPLSGPNGAATLYVVAIKQAGVWEYEILEIEIERTGARLDLRGSLPPPSTGAEGSMEAVGSASASSAEDG